LFLRKYNYFIANILKIVRNSTYGTKIILIP